MAELTRLNRASLRWISGKKGLWVVLATQGFLLAALGFWYGTYLTDPSAYIWTVPGVLAGSLFVGLYSLSSRKRASSNQS
jgi:hypothetical protein